jgi:anthranilate phosphoribosyltransferase
MDEISPAGVTQIAELRDGQIVSKQLNPKDFGITPADLEELKAADAKTNAKVLRDILSGKETGARKDIVILNAAAAVIAGNLADDFKTAIKLAEASVSSGKALECLEKLVEVSNTPRDS